MFTGQAQKLLTDMEFSRGSRQLALSLYLGKMSTVKGHLVYNQNFDLFGSPAEFNWANFAHTSDREFTVGCLLSAAATSCNLDPSKVSDGVQTSPRTFTVYSTEPRLTVSAKTGWLAGPQIHAGRSLRQRSRPTKELTEPA